MELLKQKILADGQVRAGNIVKVDNFLNHQIDIKLMNEIGKEFRRRFPEKVTKVLTIEASGIGVATITAQYFDYAPVLFAKKTVTKNLDGEVYTSKVRSFTRDIVFDIKVAKKFLDKEDKVLIIDDFLAEGQALLGLIDIVNQAGATLTGCGIVIEKGFQAGGKLIRSKGVHVESLAIIDNIDDGAIKFRD